MDVYRVCAFVRVFGRLILSLNIVFQRRDRACSVPAKSQDLYFGSGITPTPNLLLLQPNPPKPNPPT